MTTRPRSTPKAITAGLTSGITTMVAHSGGPPLAMYLLPLGLGKDIYAGTTSLFFTVGNATKAVPWLLLVKPTADVWTLMAVCLFAIPAGVWLGWRLHGALDQRQIYRACYGLLVVTALKLLLGRRFRIFRRECAACCGVCGGGAPCLAFAQLAETSLSPMTPARMRAMQSSLIGEAGSPSTATPRIAVPAAPMPVHTA